ncbi:MAG: histidine phosphatase family protein [Elusimicrobia bacterium]|nr:histidine phosphatase family protein [Candidatus Obscuribacterium magneticum]
MKIILMRHGESVPGGIWKGTDRERPLSEKGKAQLEAIVPMIGSQLSKPDLVLSSPLFRAYETAALIAKAWANVQIIELPELASGARPDAFRHALQMHRQAASILVVGHIPDLTSFLGRITGNIALLEEPVAPGDMLAVETLDEALAWGSGNLIWRKKVRDWKR